MDTDAAAPANLAIELKETDAELCTYPGKNVSFSLDVLKLIRLLFRARAPQEPISQDVFTSILVSCGVEEEAASCLFTKMDWQAMGSVSWDQFCTYMQLFFHQKQDRIMRAKRVELVEPPLLTLGLNCPVSCVRTNEGNWVVCTQDGRLSLWSAKFSLIREKCVVRPRSYRKVLRKRITGMTVAPEYSKVLLITGDREIQFFEMASFRPCFQLTSLDSAPTCVDYHCSGKDRLLVVYGDQGGCVGVLTLKQVARTFRLWSKAPLNENFIPSLHLDKAVEEEVYFLRWHVHKNWVDMIRYFPDTDQIMSCSADCEASLVIQRQRVSTDVRQARKEWDVNFKPKFQGAQSIKRPRPSHDKVVFSVPDGVCCFHFDLGKKIVATGGLDRKIRLWNCYLPRSPLGKLEGHYSRIVYLAICSRSRRLYSVSKDKWVKVWDVDEFTCLLTMPWWVHRLDGELRGAVYNHETLSFVLMGKTLAVLKLRSSQDRKVQFSTSHDLPVTCCCYNHVLNQVITACEGSVVKTWDVETGSYVSEFGNAHGRKPVTGMVMDPPCRRLITVGADGIGKIWNHNSGQLVRELQPCSSLAGDKLQATPLTTVTYLDMYLNRYILTVGRNHRLNVYCDSSDTIPFVLPRDMGFKEDRTKGHKENVLCSDFCRPNRVATGGDDGVMVWNKDNGTLIFHLEAPCPPAIAESPDDELQEDRGVNCLTFLTQRAQLHVPGTLVTGGPWGHVHIWEALYRGVLVAQFPPGLSVTAVGSDSDNTILAVGDSQGHVTVFSLDHYGVQGAEVEPPPELASWEAHRKGVTDLKVVHRRPFLITCSGDCSVRLWALEGHLVGTFGQAEPWNLSNESTFKHPRIPSDIWAAHLAMREIHKKDEEMEEEEERLDGGTTDAKRSVERGTETKLLTARLVSRPFLEAADRPVNSGIKTGLEYFARLKAEIYNSKRSRVAVVQKPEVMRMGHCVPHTQMRTHPLQQTPSKPEPHVVGLTLSLFSRKKHSSRLASPGKVSNASRNRWSSSSCSSSRNSSSSSSSSSDCTPGTRAAWSS